jgi:uncharacterized protein
MKIGVLSDTHNNTENLEIALNLFRQEKIDTVVHCGDLTGIEVANAMDGFRVLCSFGNGDVASGEIRQVLLAQNIESYAGLVFTGRLNNTRVAITHGHLTGRVEELVHSGEYDFVFQGHSHHHQDARIGFTRLINPGALGGLRREERCFCIVDLESEKVDFHFIDK